MTNSTLIEELAKALAFDDENLGWWEHLAEDQKQRTRDNVRAVLSRLADLGMSESMMVAFWSEWPSGPEARDTDYQAAFTASLRSLANE